MILSDFDRKLVLGWVTALQNQILTDPFSPEEHELIARLNNPMPVERIPGFTDAELRIILKALSGTTFTDEEMIQQAELFLKVEQRLRPIRGKGKPGSPMVVYDDHEELPPRHDDAINFQERP